MIAIFTIGGIRFVTGRDLDRSKPRKADFHKYLSDSMTSRSDQETILTQRLAQRF
jgi:hypothetical protein